MAAVRRICATHAVDGVIVTNATRDYFHRPLLDRVDSGQNGLERPREIGAQSTDVRNVSCGPLDRLIARRKRDADVEVLTRGDERGLTVGGDRAVRQIERTRFLRDDNRSFRFHPCEEAFGERPRAGSNVGVGGRIRFRDVRVGEEGAIGTRFFVRPFGPGTEHRPDTEENREKERQDDCELDQHRSAFARDRYGVRAVVTVVGR